MSQEKIFNVWVDDSERITRSLADIGLRVELTHAQEQLSFLLKYYHKELHQWSSHALATAVVFKTEDYWISLDGFGYLTLVDFSPAGSCKMEMAEQNYLLYYRVEALNALTNRQSAEIAFRRLGDGTTVTSTSDFGLPKAIQVVPSWSPSHPGYDIYGNGGGHRFLLKPDGSLVYLEGFGQKEADLARILGFEVR